MTVRIIQGDCVEQMALMEGDSVDAIVCDPPYELGFMGKSWDASGVAFRVATWAAALRVLKPGGHLLAFSGSRTYHRMVVAIEDAGFEIRDQIMWVYGSGFPKSLDVSKAIDKARDDSAEGSAVGAWLKAQREQRGLKQKDVAALWPSATGGLTGCVANWETLGKVPKWDQWLMLKAFIGFGDEMDPEVWRLNGRKGMPGNERFDREVSDAARNSVFQPTQRVVNAGTPVLDAARQWQGWGTALKPAHEPIVVARKPLVGTVAANVLRHGTGALNIDGCRVGNEVRLNMPAGNKPGGNSLQMSAVGMPQDADGREVVGRWPANLIHDGSDEVVAAFPVNAARFFKDCKWHSEKNDPHASGADNPSASCATPIAAEAAETSISASNRPASPLTPASTADCKNSTPSQNPALAEPWDNTGTTPTTPISCESSGSARPATDASISSASEAAAAVAIDQGKGTRFHYTAKATLADRNEGLADPGPQFKSGRLPHDGEAVEKRGTGNHHPTVKPTELMRYLCRLVTPPGGLVLDPFMGSGSTLKAAELEGFSAIGIELDPAYVEIARNRIAADAPLFRDIT